MPVVVDDVLLREPNLSTPRSKPIGPVKIDWSNPITRDIEQCIIPISRNKVIPLAGSIESIGSSAVLPMKSVGAAGQAMTNNGESASGVLIYNWIDLPVTASSAFSILFHGVRFSIPPTNYYSPAMEMRRNVESAGMGLAFGNGYADKTKLYWAGQGAFTGATLYVNGKKTTGTNPSDVTIVNSEPLSIVGTVTTHDIGTGHRVIAKEGPVVAKGHAHDMGFFFYTTWGRQLSASESMSLSLDPYQFLIPA